MPSPVDTTPLEIVPSLISTKHDVSEGDGFGKGGEDGGEEVSVGEEEGNGDGLDSRG